MAEPREKRGKAPMKAFNLRVREVVQMLGEQARDLVVRVTEIQREVTEEEMTINDGLEELDQVEERFNNGDWHDDGALPPMPGLVAVKGSKSRGGGGGGGGRGGEGGGRDALAAAGIDLQEESQALMSTMALAGGPAARNRFRGGEAPVFCVRTAVRKLMKRVLKSNGVSDKADAALEELLCAAVEARMRQVLQLLAHAARVAEDDASEVGPVRVLYDPAVELKRLGAAEEAEQRKREKERKAEMLKLSETNKDDARVK
jgi:hypothetical protein